MEADIEVENLGSLQRDLSALAGKLTKKGLVPILRPGAKVMQNAIKQRTPKRTGMLKRAVKVKVGKGKSTAPYATLMTYFKGSRKPEGKKKGPKTYGWFVHNGVANFGTKRNLRKGAHSEANREKALARGGYRIKPEPFVYEAFEANVQRVATAILNKIEANL
jgi:hypothetical protein